MDKRKMIAVYVDESMYIKLQDKAVIEDRSLSSLARSLINKGLNSSVVVNLNSNASNANQSNVDYSNL